VILPLGCAAGTFVVIARAHQRPVNDVASLMPRPFSQVVTAKLQSDNTERTPLCPCQSRCYPERRNTGVQTQVGPCPPPAPYSPWWTGVVSRNLVIIESSSNSHRLAGRPIGVWCGPKCSTSAQTDPPADVQRCPDRTRRHAIDAIPCPLSFFSQCTLR